MKFLDRIKSKVKSSLRGNHGDPTDPEKVKIINGVYFQTWLFSSFDDIGNAGGSLRHLKHRIGAWADYNIETREISLKTFVPKKLTTSKNYDEYQVHHVSAFPWRNDDTRPLMIKLSSGSNDTVRIKYATYPGREPVMNEVLKHDMKAIGIDAKIVYDRKSESGLIKPKSIDDLAMIKFYYSELFRDFPPQTANLSGTTLNFPNYAINPSGWTQMNYSINIPVGTVVTMNGNQAGVITGVTNNGGYTVATITTTTTGSSNVSIGYQAMTQAMQDDMDALQKDIDNLSKDMDNMFSNIKWE